MGSREKNGVKGFISFWAQRSKCAGSSARWAVRLWIFVFFVPAGFLLVCLCVGCNEVERHRILTFFFEGVPPVDQAFLPVQTVRVGAGSGTRESDGGGASASRSGQKWGSDHPSRDCNRCHFSRGGRGGRELVEPPPGLCYSCHEDHKAAGKHVHGPVVAGECLFCHEPHQSGYVHLQKAPVPDLCYRCHRREDMGTIVGHEDLLERICTDCHEAHVSTQDKLLKFFEEQAGDPNSVGPLMEEDDDPNSVM